jgi:threonine dehydrogenase-like Zn-dependent dehydrogenase
MPLGHELSGVIEEVGSAVTGIAPGMRVVLHPGRELVGNGGLEGGFAPRLLVRNAAAGGRLYPIPDDLGNEAAALVEPLGVGMHAVDRADVQAGDKAVVLGAGPIGLAAIATLRDRGVEDVVAMDLSARRLEIARSLGASATIDAGSPDAWDRLRELHGETDSYGEVVSDTDVYVEASGAPSVLPVILRVSKRRARLSVVALHYEETPVRFLTVLMKELTIRGAMEYPDDFNDMFGLLERWDLSPMITHRFPLERFTEAFAVARDPAVSGKVMIEIS